MVTVWLTLASLFKVWMILDAVRRGGACCGNYWIYVILVPFGDLLYFLFIKLQDPEWQRIIGPLLRQPPRLAEIRALANHCPSQQNQLRLFFALVESKCFADATDVHRKLSVTTDETAFGLATSLHGLGHYDKALSVLVPLLEREPGALSYRAALLKERCLWDSNQHELAILFLQSLVTTSGKLPIAIVLARRLIELGRMTEADAVLKKSLEEHNLNPLFLRRAARWDSLRGRWMLWQLRHKNMLPARRCTPLCSRAERGPVDGSVSAREGTR